MTYSKEEVMKMADNLEQCSNHGNTCVKIVQSEEENREITRDGVK